MLYLVFLCFLAAAINAQVSEDVLCEGRYFEPSCPQGTVRIVSGAYGKTDAMFCGGRDPRPWSFNCANDVASTLRATCQGKRSCSVLVDGPEACSGTSKYLQVIWSCDNVVVQTKQNDRGKNIVVSNSASRANPVPLHSQNVAGQLYIILEPAADVSQVRWYLDSTTQIYSTETAAPFDLRGGRAWDTLKVADGTHVIAASITFTDGSTGRVDATFNVRNGNAATPARAVVKATDSFVDSPASEQSNNKTMSTYVPWSLFGVACLIIAALIVVIVIKRKANSKSAVVAERA